MITGIGTDIIEVQRVADKMQRHASFREFVFSPAEIDYCEKMAYKYAHYAARFAAKEALLKALGKGWQKGTAFNEIETLPNADGKPEIHLLGNTKQTLQELTGYNVQVSLSHVKEMAVAFVMIEKL